MNAVAAKDIAPLIRDILTAGGSSMKPLRAKTLEGKLRVCLRAVGHDLVAKQVGKKKVKRYRVIMLPIFEHLQPLAYNTYRTKPSNDQAFYDVVDTLPSRRLQGLVASGTIQSKVRMDYVTAKIQASRKRRVDDTAHVSTNESVKRVRHMSDDMDIDA